MSIFSDFDNHFGAGVFDSHMHPDGSTDFLHHGEVVQHASPHDLVSFDDHGHIVYHTDNGFGGHDTHVNGILTRSTVPNIHGGEDIHDGQHHLIRQTMDNVLGGENFYDANHALEGMSYDNHVGGESFISFNDHSNAEQILGYDDPLIHSGQYIMTPFHPLLMNK